jgi:hypothetical protein
MVTVKGKAIPVQAYKSHEIQVVKVPRVFRELAHDSGKIVSPMLWPTLPPGKIPGTHFC